MQVLEILEHQKNQRTAVVISAMLLSFCGTRSANESKAEFRNVGRNRIGTSAVEHY